MTSAAYEVRAVAIGASAGGVEAVSTVLEALPADFRPSVLVVIHIPPDRPSLLAQVLGHRCRIPVHEALDKEGIEPGTVYVAPPDYHLLVESEGTLSLSLDAPVAFSRPSIDVMFESAAAAFGERLLGIVMSGANDDGSQGLSAIRKAGGRGWVQRPEDAIAATMPAAAILAAGPDLVLPARELGERLAHLRSGKAFTV
jgi:two-component system chemotaxis response regulator CheB